MSKSKKQSFLNKFFQWAKFFFLTMDGAYNKLSKSEQELSKQASGLIAIINKNLTANPDFVLEVINSKYPNLNREKIFEILKKAGIIFGVIDNTFDGTLEDALIKIQDLLKNTPSKNIWVIITQTIVVIAVEILSPTTPIQKIMFVIEYVYQKFIKKEFQS